MRRCPMQVRIALLHGCYLIALENGRVHVHCEDRLYAADEELPLVDGQTSPKALTARDFVRHSMHSLVGPDEQDWPSLARRFAGSAQA